jgi:PIN domain nuclease of toxin-antitoxin system
MSSVVFDASCLFILIKQEPGVEAVDAIDGDIVMSSVNYAEIVTKLALSGGSPGTIENILAEYMMTVVPFTERLAKTAGLLVTHTRRLGLSLGDRACLAVGMELGLPVITADRARGNLDLGVEIRVIR